jgi:hypothetical protein
MKRRWHIQRMIVVIAILAGLLGHHTAVAAPSPVSEKKAANSLYDQRGTTPNAELEGLHFPTAAVHVVVQKNLGSSLLPTSLLFSADSRAFENRQLKTTAGLAKDYLFFIYPSHHFW